MAPNASHQQMDLDSVAIRDEIDSASASISHPMQRVIPTATDPMLAQENWRNVNLDAADMESQDTEVLTVTGASRSRSWRLLLGVAGILGAAMLMGSIGTLLVSRNGKRSQIGSIFAIRL